MPTLEEKGRILLEKVRAQTNPGNRGLEISVFVARALREKEISLYEAYLLTGVRMELTRLAYIQPAWADRVRITILLEWLNMRLLAAVLGEKTAEAHWVQRAKEAFSLNQEKRPHYILDHYPEYLKETISQERLRALRDVRASRRKPFDDGPYHTEVFPYDECNCEELLLRGTALPAGSKRISPDVESLLVELDSVVE